MCSITNKSLHMVTYSAEFLENLQIPIDLFVSKKRRGPNSGLRFTNAVGELAYRIERRRSSTHAQLVADPSGNPLVFINRHVNGSWQAFKGNNSKEENLIFSVKRKLDTDTRTEFEMFRVGENEEESAGFKMKGSRFFRACTIYKGDSIVAQTSLMYKLGIQKVLVSRHRFRLTIFPGFEDHTIVVALIVIFFHRRKLWI